MGAPNAIAGVAGAGLPATQTSGADWQTQPAKKKASNQGTNAGANLGAKGVPTPMPTFSVAPSIGAKGAPIAPAFNLANLIQSLYGPQVI